MTPGGDRFMLLVLLVALLVLAIIVYRSWPAPVGNP